MVGYVRNDTVNNIADGNIINAEDLDGEFDAVQAAFDATSGHAHDGTVGGGAPILTLGPTKDVESSASAFFPRVNNTVDLGTSTLQFKNFWLDGTANIDNLVADTADINAGTIDNVVIGGTTPASGSFTTLFADSLDIEALNDTPVGNITPSTGAFTTLTADSLTVDSLNGTVIGNITPAAGTFTALAATTSFSVTGNITVTGTVDGRDIASDGSKLDGIEAGADVTDTANVTAAGALMDSELSNISAVKGLNQSVSTSGSPSFSGLTVNGVFVATKVNETFQSISSVSGTATVNTNNGNVFSISLSENTTFVFSNPPTSGTAYGFTLKVAQGLLPYAVTWPASVLWPGGFTPSLSSVEDNEDIFVFFTHDAGTNWYGFVAGQGMG